MSPELKAQAWPEADPNYDEYSQERKDQRLALATFFYATGGETSWKNTTDWLSYDVDECDWYATLVRLRCFLICKRCGCTARHRIDFFIIIQMKAVWILFQREVLVLFVLHHSSWLKVKHSSLLSSRFRPTNNVKLLPWQAPARQVPPPSLTYHVHSMRRRASDELISSMRVFF